MAQDLKSTKDTCKKYNFILFPAYPVSLPVTANVISFLNVLS